MIYIAKMIIICRKIKIPFSVYCEKSLKSRYFSCKTKVGKNASYKTRYGSLNNSIMPKSFLYNFRCAPHNR